MAKLTKTVDIWSDDKLNIRKNVIDFAHILEQEAYVANGNSKVYSISAEFGVGKTFFCTKLQKVLEQDNVPVSMLNIWETDFYDNPLIPLLIRIKDVYDKYNKNRTLMAKSGKVALKIAKEAGNAVIKYKYGININKFIKLYQKLKPSQSDIYNNYQEFDNELKKLKKQLSSWAERLNKPIVIIIDELDRCKPDYAVKTLETLKHFFDIPGFVFVLAIDEDQLKSSVETLFGTKNFDGYKRKFINNSFILPSPDIVSFTDYLYYKSGLSNIIEQIEKKEKDLVFMIRNPNPSSQNYTEIQQFNKMQTSEQIIKNYFAYYSTWFGFTLRHMEQVFDRLVLFAKSTLSDNELFSSDLAVSLVCLHEFDIKIYNNIRAKPYITETHQTLLSRISEEGKKIYKENYTEHFKPERTDLLPGVPKVPSFSSVTNNFNSEIQVIYHNVDRFFKIEKTDPTKWIRDEQNQTYKYVIDNKQRLAKITYPESDKNWQGKRDFDNVTNFDLEAFKQKYFDKMDFISSFE